MVLGGNHLFLVNQSVMEIQEKKIYKKQSNIKDVSKVHCVKYIVDKNGALKYHVWQYYGIGKGKEFKVGEEPACVKRKVTIPFKQQHLSVGKAGLQSKANEIVYCSEPMCVKSFASVDMMLKHLDFGKHEYQTTKSSRMLQVRDQWVKRFTDGDSKSLPGGSTSISSNEESIQPPLSIGWAIPKRNYRRLTEEQKEFLDKVFDEGERTSSKVTPEMSLSRMKEKFETKDYLPLATIKAYFSRRAKKVRTGEITVNDEVEEYDELEDVNEDNEEVDEQEREGTVAGIKHSMMKRPDLEPDDWIAVAFARAWYPGQFISYDEDIGEVFVNFLERTSSSSRNFVWPMLSRKMKEDKCWAKEGDVIYRLSQPTQGARDTLIFAEFDDVNDCFAEWRESLKHGKK